MRADANKIRTYPFLLHVNHEGPPSKCPNTEEMNVLRAVELLRGLSCVRTMRRRGHKSLDMVCEERLEEKKKEFE